MKNANFKKEHFPKREILLGLLLIIIFAMFTVSAFAATPNSNKTKATKDIQPLTANQARELLLGNKISNSPSEMTMPAGEKNQVAIPASFGKNMNGMELAKKYLPANFSKPNSRLSNTKYYFSEEEMPKKGKSTSQKSAK